MTRTVLISGLLFLQVACSSLQPLATEEPVATTDSTVLQRLQQSLPGVYGNFEQHWAVSREDPQNDTADHWRMSVTRLRSNPGEAWFSLHQYLASDANQDHTLLLNFFYEGEQLILRFAPYSDTAPPRELNAQQLQAVARFLPGCEVLLSNLGSKLAGQTSTSNCRVAGNDGGVLALIKDFAFTAESIDIGDRIMDPASGSQQGDDRIFRFNRMLQFQGWAGLKSEGEAEWQLATPLEIWSDGGTAQLLNINGEQMGYRIRLARVRWRTDQAAILRLDLLNDQTGEIIAYSFADNDAGMLGINLGWIQVGLVQTLP
jgi:hypothetical protein